jgi:molybdopterin-containing oxidoreductase family iron-sulfur binding subunit
VEVRATDIAVAASENAPAGIEILFRPDPSVSDGRWASNAWLQELPKPLTQLVWDNAALMSAATAEQLGVSNEDVVEIGVRGRAVEAPVFILPGQAAGCITLHLGYGRWQAGEAGNERGFDANRVRFAEAPWILAPESLRRTGKTYRLVTTQEHHAMEGRHVARQVSAAEYAAHPALVADLSRIPRIEESLYPPPEHTGEYAWGMAIDLSSCIGCNACVIACQAENNIPTVGKNEVANSREMHWIRIDTYRTGPDENPEVMFEPMLCQHCEYAPCEVVCPVEATTHSDEGLNEMTYNRCVGTRYCSNNCPYKVRRFNFFQYAVWDVPQFKLLYNPEVTVRSRGVMEKCTYCVQRINRARIDAKLEDRRMRDGDVRTACQAVCPSNAIVFGNILDPEAEVSRKKAEPRNYSVLGELNTRPRTTYLARLKNPNPDLKAS